MHAFRNRALATAALVPRLERTLVLALKFAPLHLTPGRTLPGEPLGTPRPPLLAGTTVQSFELCLHLNRISEPVRRVELNRLS